MLLAWPAAGSAQMDAAADSGAASSASEGASLDATVAPAAVELGSLREGIEVPFAQRLLSFGGLLVLLSLAWVVSTNRKRVDWRVIGWGMGLQILFAIFVLKTQAGLWIFRGLNDAVVKLLDFTNEGSAFIFGAYLTNEFSFALNILPTIIFFSSLMAVFYHLGVMQKAVSGLAWVMRRTMGTSGSETLSAAANIFVGQTEAPLVVKPYVDTMTRSELHAVMVGGFATVAGGVLAAYVGMLREHFPDIAGHLIAASVMSAPAALVVSKLMVPETEESKTRGEVKLAVEKLDVNLLDAAARGAAEGLKLALNVGAMLLAFLALLALLNYLLGVPVELFNFYFEASYVPVTIQQILGWLFWPVAFVMGVAPEDCSTIAALLGEKIVLTEFVAYAHLAEAIPSSGLQPRSIVIATYALCGFANFGSIAIQIGGIGSIAPKRRGDLAKLGLRAMIGGTLATCLTGTVAGMLV